MVRYNILIKIPMHLRTEDYCNSSMPSRLSVSAALVRRGFCPVGIQSAVLK